MKKLVAIYPDSKLLTSKHASLLAGIIDACRESELDFTMKILADKSIGFYTKDWYI